MDKSGIVWYSVVPRPDKLGLCDPSLIKPVAFFKHISQAEIFGKMMYGDNWDLQIINEWPDLDK